MAMASQGMHDSDPIEKTSTRELLRHVTAFKRYVEETPATLKVMCFIGGIAVVVNGIFGVLDLFSVFDKPVYYVVNAYQVFFGIVTCVTELDEDWCGGNVHSWLHQRQKWMHEWALGLTMLWGRGLFYVFQGVLALVSSSLLSVGVVIGLYMVVSGGLCINQHFKEHRHHQQARIQLPADAYRELPAGDLPSEVPPLGGAVNQETIRAPPGDFPVGGPPSELYGALGGPSAEFHGTGAPSAEFHSGFPRAPPNEEYIRVQY